MQISIADLLLAGQFDRRDGKSIQEVKIPKKHKKANWPKKHMSQG